MKATLCGIAAAAVVLALAATVQAGLTATAKPQVRIETRPDTADPNGPNVRIWINGREVQPGEPIELGEGGAIRIESRVSMPEGRPDREAPGGAYLGVMVGPRGGEGTPPAPGAVVTSIMPDSPAARADLKVGDIITDLSGVKVEGPRDLVERIQRSRPGDVVRLTVQRGDRNFVTATVKLGVRPEEGRPEGRPGMRPEGRPEGRLEGRPEGRPDMRPEGRPEGRPEAPAPGTREPRRGEAYLGVIATPLTEEMVEIAGIDHGVLVNSLTDDSPAARAGLQPGDVIVSVGGANVNSPEELVERVRSHRPGDEVPVMYYRMGKRRTAEVKLGQRPEGGPREEGPRILNVPEDLYQQVPELRQYLDHLRRGLEAPPSGPWRERPMPGAPVPGTPMPHMPMPGATVPHMPMPEAPAMPHMAPYDIGKDIGQILERLDRLEKRLDAIEKRLQQPGR